MRTATLMLVLALGPVATLLGPPARAQSPSAAQPRLPSAETAPAPTDVPTKPSPQVVDTIVDPTTRPPLDVRKPAARDRVVRQARAARQHRHAVPVALDRPALAGVTLLDPLPAPGEPPHVAVPLPAYPLDSVAWDFTAPPPPIVCHRTRREPGLPDPHLYREVTLECVPDNP